MRDVRAPLAGKLIDEPRPCGDSEGANVCPQDYECRKAANESLQKAFFSSRADSLALTDLESGDLPHRVDAVSGSWPGPNYGITNFDNIGVRSLDPGSHYKHTANTVLYTLDGNLMNFS